jgi:hypothetical protein
MASSTKDEPVTETAGAIRPRLAGDVPAIRPRRASEMPAIRPLVPIPSATNHPRPAPNSPATRPQRPGHPPGSSRPDAHARRLSPALAGILARMVAAKLAAEASRAARGGAIVDPPRTGAGHHADDANR